MKQLWIKNEDGLVDVFNVRKHVLDYKPEGFDEKTPLGPRYIEVMRVEDHERIVAELKAELDERTEQLETTMERYRAPARTIATQKRVLEKLKTYVQHRVDCICRAGVLQYSDSCDCGLEAISEQISRTHR